MATVYFVKDGKRPTGERLTTSIDVSAALLVAKLGRFDTRHTEIPPTINPDVQASDWSNYKHVVLEIQHGEEMHPLSKPGYYYVIGLTPVECKSLLGISITSV